MSLTMSSSPSFFTWTLQTQKAACDKVDPSFYPKFKQQCDDYFLIKVGHVLAPYVFTHIHHHDVAHES